MAWLTPCVLDFFHKPFMFNPKVFKAEDVGFWYLGPYIITLQGMWCDIILAIGENQGVRVACVQFTKVKNQPSNFFN